MTARPVARPLPPMTLLSALRSPTPQRISHIKALLFALCLIPFCHLAWGIFRDSLGANPVEAITRGTGDWILRFLLITLAITPVRKLIGWHWLVRLRRMFGLYAFFYATLHLLIYLWLDQSFDLHAILKDIGKRPFITVGFTAFILMLPLAITSSNAMIRRLGARRWQSLHTAIYPIGILGVIHFWWLVKRDIREPLLYALLLAALLAPRLWWRLRAPSATV